MAAMTVRFTVRTPHEVVFDADVQSVRVITETGQVGVRPNMEPLVLPIEAGLVLIRTGTGTAFVGSAGGLLSSDGRQTTLFTPLAVAGVDAGTLQAALDREVADPDSEFAVRARLGKLQGRILAELHTPAGERALLAGGRR